MRRPRTNDFDPQAPPELKSPLDDFPAIAKPTPGTVAEHRVESPTQGLRPKPIEVQPADRQPTLQATNQPSKVPSLLGSLEPRNQGFTTPPAEASSFFDLNETPYKNDTFAFTVPELEAIEDLKTELRRKLDLRATKYDIVRCAIHLLLEDYRRQGSDSMVVRRIRTKRNR